MQLSFCGLDLRCPLGRTAVEGAIDGGVEHAVLRLEAAYAVILSGDTFDRPDAQSLACVFGGNKLAIDGTLQGTGTGVVHRDAQGVVVTAGVDDDPPVGGGLLFADVQGVFQQVAQDHGDLGVRHTDLAGDACRRRIADAAVFGLLGEKQQHGVGGDVVTKAAQRVVRQASAVLAEVVLSLIHI